MVVCWVESLVDQKVVNSDAQKAAPLVTEQAAPLVDLKVVQWETRTVVSTASLKADLLAKQSVVQKALLEVAMKGERWVVKLAALTVFQWVAPRVAWWAVSSVATMVWRSAVLRVAGWAAM